MVLQIVAHGAFRGRRAIWTARSSICWSLARTVLPILRSAHVERRRPLTVETAGDALRPFLRTRRVETGLIRVGQQIRHHVGQCGIVEIGVAMHVEPCLFGMDGMLRVSNSASARYLFLPFVVLLP